MGVITRAAGRVKNVQNLTGRVGSGLVKRFSHLAGLVRSGQECFQSHWSGHVGSSVFQIPLSGPVGSRGDGKLTGRVRSCHDPQRNGSLAGLASMARQLFSADPAVEPAHPARESDVSNTSRLLPKGLPRTNNEKCFFGIRIKHKNTPPNLNTHVHVRIHQYPRQPGHTPLLSGRYKNQD